jgi:hypothetical protein
LRHYWKEDPFCSLHYFYQHGILGLSLEQGRTLLELVRQLGLNEWEQPIKDCYPELSQQTNRVRLGNIPLSRSVDEIFLEGRLRRNWTRISNHFALRRLFNVHYDVYNRRDDPVQLLQRHPEVAPLVRVAIAETCDNDDEFYAFTEADCDLAAAVDAILHTMSLRTQFSLDTFSVNEFLSYLGISEGKAEDSPRRSAWMQLLARAEGGFPLKQLFLDEMALVMDRHGWPYFFVSGRQAERMRAHLERQQQQQTHTRPNRSTWQTALVGQLENTDVALTRNLRQFLTKNFHSPNDLQEYLRMDELVDELRTFLNQFCLNSQSCIDKLRHEVGINM